MVTVSTAGMTLQELADLFTAGFAGYVIPMQMTVPALAERICAEDIDLSSSRVVMLDAAPAGLGLIARRGRESRLAAMGIVAAARSRGAGRALMADLVSDARARGDRRMRLEVFESNAPAIKLYEGCGFRRVRRLVGYELQDPPAEPVALEEIDATEFARQMEDADLPWQLARGSLSAPPQSARVFTLERKAFAYVSAVSAQAVSVRGIFTAREFRRQGLARWLLRGLAALFPRRALSVPPLLPEGMGAPFFAALGFGPGKLTQLEMAVELGG